MEQLASKEGKQIWLEQLTRPYSLTSPFGGLEYVCILFSNDQFLTSEEQNLISGALVQTGCKYAVCTGHKSSSWDDSVDFAHLEQFAFNPPDNEHVMTTWHENESVEEIVSFGLNLTNFDSYDFNRFLVLFVGQKEGLRGEVEKAVQSQWMNFAG